MLPLFHAFSGKDDTSFLYGLGKKKLWKSLQQIDAIPLRTFAEDPTSQTVSEELIASCLVSCRACIGRKLTNFG